MTANHPVPTPPVAPRRPQRFARHGEEVVDDYFWLRERDTPEVLAYLQAEQSYYEAATAHTADLRRTLYAEMRGRIQEADLSAPYQVGDYWYYQRTEEGQQYPVYCRRRGNLEAAEEVLLDVNALAAGRDYTEIGPFEISPDHRLLAYGVDHSGAERYELRVVELASGATLSSAIQNVYYSLAWASDSRTLFYTVVDHATRPYKVLRHQVGEGQGADQEIFCEPDEKYFVQVYRSKSGSYIFVAATSKLTSEVHFLPADAPQTALRVVEPRSYRREYCVEHHGGRFYIVTNDQARDFRLMAAPAETPGRDHWVEIIPHRPSVKLDRVELFRDHMAVYHRAEGLRQLLIAPMTADGPVMAAAHRLAFPEPVYAFFATRNLEFNTALVRIVYSSSITPETTYDYDMAARTLLLRKQQPVLGGYNPARYTMERVWAAAADGVQVPISLVYRKDLPLDRSNALLLYGYGSYGSCMDPYFNTNYFSLIDRGFVFAISHIRGGGELGRGWYESGKLLEKKTTFTDFIACAEHLIAAGYCHPRKLTAMGVSAGGLLMGAVINLRPELFAAVVAKVPFVDVVSTMLDPTIPLTVTEYEEWGNPEEPAYYAYMRSYSPYDNLAAGKYPAILATSSYNDPRVAYWEPAKWVAKLRVQKTNDSPLLLRVNMGAGHGGASGRFDYLEEVAGDYAFLLDCTDGREPAAEERR